MKKRFSWKLILNAFLIAVIGVMGVDFLSHLFFSTPMENAAYFSLKALLFFLFSVAFLKFIETKKKEFWKVAIAGVVVASLWGIYYNVLPEIFNYYPFGISLYGLSFWGMGIIGTGIAFGVVHTLAFVVGYYLSKLMLGKHK